MTTAPWSAAAPAQGRNRRWNRGSPPLRGGIDAARRIVARNDARLFQWRFFPGQHRSGRRVNPGQKYDYY